MVLCPCQAIDLEVDLCEWTFPSIWMFLTTHVYHTSFNWIFVSFFTAKGAEHDIQFTIVRPFSRIRRIMEFIHGMDGPLRPFEGFYHASVMFVSTSIITCTFNCIFFSLFLILLFSFHICCMHLNLIKFHFLSGWEYFMDFDFLFFIFYVLNNYDYRIKF